MKSNANRRLKRILAVILVGVMMIVNTSLDFMFSDRLSVVEAATATLTSADIANKFKEKIETLEWAEATLAGSSVKTQVSEAFWKDTSGLYISQIDIADTAKIKVDAALPGSVGCRIRLGANTGISDCLTVGGKVSENVYSGVTSIYTYSTASGESITLDGAVLEQELANPASDLWDSVASTSADNSTTKTIVLSGKSRTYPQALLDEKLNILASLYYTVEYDYALEGYYRNYYVSTADQLAVLLYYYDNTSSSDSSAGIKAISSETDGAVEGKTNAIVSKLGITLLCDLDLGGRKNVRWCGYRNTSWCLEINGNGHHIYNGYFNNTLLAKTYTWTETENTEELTGIKTEVSVAEGASTQYGCFLGNTSTAYNPATGKTSVTNNVDQKFAIRDLTFGNMYIDQELGMFNNASYAYFNNVNWEHCLAAGSEKVYGAYGLVLKNSYGRCYFKDCMIYDSYMVGNAHCALFTSYNNPYAKSATTGASYIGDTTGDVKSWYYIDIPELVTKTDAKGAVDTPITDSVEAVELTWYNNYYVKADNGAVNKLTSAYPTIFENCAAVDSEVYDIGANHSGTFVSCMQSDIIFKNCFSNCTIYANKMLGVFTGACIGSGDGFYYPYNGERTLVNTYFENCYTAGSIEGNDNIGGFVGMVFNDTRAYDLTLSGTPATANRGQVVFKNCYSTSSVGMQYSGDYVGGFIGAYINYKDTVNGYQGTPNDTMLQPLSEGNNTITLKNCYYDKQTTAMRERDAGYYNATQGILTGTLSGLTGVYTQSSDAKKVSGLTDTVDMNAGLQEGEEAAWTNTSVQYYPQLLAFSEKPDRSAYPEGLAGELQYNRQLEYYYSSLASTATVFLNHYDRMLDEYGIEVDAAPEIYDTVRDITQKFVFTTEGSDGIKWTNDNSAGSKNAQDGFVNKMGQTDGSDKTGFKLSYDNDDDGTDDFSYDFDPQVLVIGEYDGIYKCLDFAPGKQWVKVTASNAAVSGDSGTVTGMRRLRLLPTAYLNAGHIIHINVVKDEQDGIVTDSKVNSVTIMGDDNKEILLPGLFNHSVGVSYAITDRYRMDTSGIYTSQKLTQYTGGTTPVTDKESFAFYSTYSVTDDTSEKLLGANTTVDGVTTLSGMLDQNIKIAANGGITNLSSSGKTMVKVYRAAPSESNGTVRLEKQDEIDYNVNDNLAKWQGEKPFTLDDTGFYYMDYYWRLDDGRYLTDSKLVRISADSYSVEVVTGILDQEHTVNTGASLTTKTAIDQYVTDQVTPSESGEGADKKYTWDLTFPSLDENFGADNAETYYSDYNVLKEYNGDQYYTKSLKLTTLDKITAVGWYKNNNYTLTTLIIEAIDQYGISHEMARVDTAAGDNQFDFNDAEYTYDFTTYAVTQDKETKLFSITENSSVPITFRIDDASYNAINSITKYIVFDFTTTDDNQATYAQINDSLRVTALFRENTANVEAEKTVLLNADTELKEVSTETVGEATASYYEELFEYSKKFETDNSKLSDNEIGEDRNRKAVLSGDTLTYRVKLHNAGYFDSDVVNVYDTVPEGCTYVPDSMKIYRQSVQFADGTARYGALETMETGEAGIDTGGYGISQPSDDNGQLWWRIPSISLDYEYYVEYQVTVKDIKATDVKRVLENTATWDFICLNGNVTGDDNAHDIETLRNTAIFNLDVDVEESSGESETRTYSVEFSQKDANSAYKNIVFTNTFPQKGFTLDEDEGITLWKLNADGQWEMQPTNGDGRPQINIGRSDNRAVDFTISELNVRQGETYRVQFTGKQVLLGNAVPETGEIIKEISNKASIIYQREKEDGTLDDAQGNIVAKTERISNEVTTDVTHLYLNIEKNIGVEDPAQPFLMQIAYYEDEKDTEPELFYTKVNCTKPIQSADDPNVITGYSGSQIVQCDKRGIYVVTEVTDWSATDYDFDHSAAVHMSLADSTSKLIYPDGVKMNRLQSPCKENSVTFVFPGLMYASGAFPASLGTDLTVMPTAEFYNGESEYAYLSGQAYSENYIASK